MTEEAQDHTPPKRRTALWITIVLALVALGAVGAVGHFAGAGWFGYRQVLYGVNDIYLLNMSEHALWVSVEGREAVEVAAEGARLVDIMGGVSRVVVKDGDGKIVGEHEVLTDHSSALLKLSQDGCLAVSDVGAFYGRGGDDLKIIRAIDQKTQLYVPGTEHIIWPRQTFPRSIPSGGGDVLWIELVGCVLIDEPDFMRGYLDVRLGERLAKARGDKDEKSAP